MGECFKQEKDVFDESRSKRKGLPKTVRICKCK